MTDRLRIMIVDDHDVVRMGLKQVFDSRVDMEIAAEARTGEEAIAAIRKEPFDVALVDLSLSDMSGVDVLTRAKAIRPEMAVLIVSGYPEDQYAINILKAGASGFVPKDAPPESLVSAVLAATQGRRYVSPRVAMLNAGSPRRIMLESKTTAASAPRSSAARKSTIECPPVSSSPSQQTRTLTGSSPAAASSRAPARSMYSCPLSSTVPRP